MQLTLHRSQIASSFPGEGVRAARLLPYHTPHQRPMYQMRESLSRQFEFAPLPGDFDGDGLLTVADVDLLTAESASGNHDPAFDLTSDSLVDEDDVDLWVRDLKRTWTGDADVNLAFDSSDMVQVFTTGKYEKEEAAVWSHGDWNGDGFFNSSDMVKAFVDGGYEKGLRTGAAAVPEPTSLTMFLAGLLGLAACRQGRRHHMRRMCFE